MEDTEVQEELDQKLLEQEKQEGMDNLEELEEMNKQFEVDQTRFKRWRSKRNWIKRFWSKRNSSMMDNQVGEEQFQVLNKKLSRCLKRKIKKLIIIKKQIIE